MRLQKALVVKKTAALGTHHDDASFCKICCVCLLVYHNPLIIKTWLPASKNVDQLINSDFRNTSPFENWKLCREMMGRKM